MQLVTGTLSLRSVDGLLSPVRGSSDDLLKRVEVDLPAWAGHRLPYSMLLLLFQMLLLAVSLLLLVMSVALLAKLLLLLLVVGEVIALAEDGDQVVVILLLAILACSELVGLDVVACSGSGRHAVLHLLVISGEAES